MITLKSALCGQLSKRQAAASWRCCRSAGRSGRLIKRRIDFELVAHEAARGSHVSSMADKITRDRKNGRGKSLFCASSVGIHVRCCRKPDANPGRSQ